MKFQNLLFNNFHTGICLLYYDFCQLFSVQKNCVEIPSLKYLSNEKV